MFTRALVVALLLASPLAAQDKVFRAGAYAQDITPEKFPVSVNGGFQDRLAKGSHDPLHARCLVLDDGTTKLAFVVVDSCLIPREIVDRAKHDAAKSTGIPYSNILVSATHTHTAPTVTQAFQSEPDADYVKLLPKRITEGIEKAHARLEPAKIGWGVGSDPTQVFNRRWFMKPEAMLTDPFGRPDGVKMNPGYQNPNLEKPAGPIDPEISFLSVVRADGKPLALLANYSLHYVGGVEALSADYFAAYADKMAQLLEADEKFVGIMSNGTSGNINNVNFAGPAPKRQPYEQIRVVSESVARATHAAWKKIEHKPHATLAAATLEIELGVRKPGEADLARAREIVAAVRAQAEAAAQKDPKIDPTKNFLKTSDQVFAGETIAMSQYPDTVKLVLQAIRVGDVAIAAIPCEVFVEIGLEIKEKSKRKPTFTISLANGYNGYLPTPEHHKLGGYETWRARSSYLETEASPKIVATISRLLEKVR